MYALESSTIATKKTFVSSGSMNDRLLIMQLIEESEQYLLILSTSVLVPLEEATVEESRLLLGEKLRTHRKKKE